MSHTKNSTKDTAVLILDPQNDLFDVNGKFFPMLQPVLEKYSVISNINATIDFFRSRGAHIIFSPIAVPKAYFGADNELYGVFKSVVAADACKQGEWGVEISDIFHKEVNDTVFTRNNISAFENTPLTKILEEKGVSKIVLGGALTDVCIETSMRQAYDKGLKVTTVTDACVTWDDENQTYLVNKTFPMFSQACSSASLRDYWSRN